MINRIALATCLLAVSAPLRADPNAAKAEMQRLQGGNPNYDGSVGKSSCTTGRCGVIQKASDGALESGNLTVAPNRYSRASVAPEVPTPSLGADKEGSKDKPGFFSNIFKGKGLLYGLGGAAAGAGIGWLVGGPIGAIVGGLLGAIGGFFLSKMLAK